MTFVAVTAILLISMVTSAQAVETKWGEMDVTFDATWVSKYIWRGFDLQDDKAAFQPSLNFDFFDSGWSFNIWWNIPGSSKGAANTSLVDAEEMDYTITYANSFWQEETYQTDYAVSWVYYDYPDKGSEDADAQEFNFDLSWPKLMPYDIKPHYTYIYMWAAQGGGPAAANEIGGPIHVFGLAYDLSVQGFMPYNDTQVFNFTWDIVYNEGTGHETVDHDWSHTVWGVSTDINIGKDGQYGHFIPAVNYQHSMDDSVNDENEFWTGLSYNYTF
jgi:hypothetical protein